MQEGIYYRSARSVYQAYRWIHARRAVLTVVLTTILTLLQFRQASLVDQRNDGYMNALASVSALNNSNSAFAGEVAQSGLLFAWVEHCRTCQGNYCIEEVCRYRETLEEDFDKSQISLTEIRQQKDGLVQRHGTFIDELLSMIDKTGKKLTNTWLLYLLGSFTSTTNPMVSPPT